MARPTTYTQELSDEICEHLSLGESIRTVCYPEHMPAISTFYEWIRNHEEFSKQYARAKQESADAMAEEVLYIADNQIIGQTLTIKGDGSTETKEEDMLGHRRLQIDTRKWLMAKMKPKKYGDKLDLTSDGDKISPVQSLTDEQINERIKDYLDRNKHS